MMKGILDFVRPPENADWKSVNRWRWNVALTLIVLVTGAGFAVSPKGFALASEVEKTIDKKIEDKIAPVVKEQQEQRVVLNRMSDLLLNQLMQAKAAEIRLTVSKRCKAQTFEERDRLNGEKDRLQREYAALNNGVKYDEPGCGEL